MRVSVFKYSKQCGNDNLLLDFYQIVPDDEDGYLFWCKKLLSEGVRKVTFYDIDVTKGIVDCNKNIIKYPQFGFKRHISNIMRSSKLSVIINVNDVTLKDEVRRLEGEDDYVKG